MAEKYRRNPNINCVICDKAIYRRPIEIQRNKNKAFCSQACYGISCRKEKPCAVCGKLILSGENKKTCSRKCANKGRVGIRYGAISLKSKVKSYKSLKTRLLAQRGVSCERCSYNKYEILQIHHKDKNRSNNELENLELICPNCHAEKHFLKNSWLNKSTDV